MTSEVLSICFAVRNRSRVELENGSTIELFPDCLRSLVKSIPDPKFIEIVICDFGSTDWPLSEWIDDIIDGIPYKIIQTDEDFHRGLGRNIAADNATGKNLLFLDADLILTSELISNGVKFLESGSLYYPICFYFLNPEHTIGFWADGAKGIMFMPTEIYKKAGKWPCPPEFTEHKNEDQAFFRRIKDLGVPIVNEREQGYFHQYHPGLSANQILRRKRQLIRQFENGQVLE